MFKERYIKDNQLIQPDDDFLARMKDAVLQEQQTLQIGEYVDYENADDYSEIENYESVSTVDSRWGKRMNKWAPFVLAAACVALVCGVFIGTGNVEFSKQKGLKVNLESMLKGNASQDISDEKATFDALCKMIKNDDEVVYRLEGTPNFDDKKISDLKKKSSVLSDEDKEQLLGDILQEQYQLVATMNQMQSPVYYMVCFNTQQYAVLVLDEDELYIMKISEIETFAVR